MLPLFLAGGAFLGAITQPEPELYNHTLRGERILAKEVVCRNQMGNANAARRKRRLQFDCSDQSGVYRAKPYSASDYGRACLSARHCISRRAASRTVEFVPLPHFADEPRVARTLR